MIFVRSPSTKANCVFLALCTVMYILVLKCGKKSDVQTVCRESLFNPNNYMFSWRRGFEASSCLFCDLFGQCETDPESRCWSLWLMKSCTDMFLVCYEWRKRDTNRKLLYADNMKLIKEWKQMSFYLFSFYGRVPDRLLLQSKWLQPPRLQCLQHWLNSLK